jgi:hypothetical protein
MSKEGALCPKSIWLEAVLGVWTSIRGVQSTPGGLC